MVVTYRPNRASFDLAHLATLSGEPYHVLLVSERTYYLLLNTAAADLSDLSRYAVTILPGGDYVPVGPDDAEFALATDVIERANVELFDMSDEILNWLDNISHRVAPYKSITVATSLVASTTGTKVIDLGAVPAGEMWRCTRVSLIYSGGVCAHFGIILTASPLPNMYVRVTFSPTSGVWYHESLGITLTEGQKITCEWSVTTAPSTLQLFGHFEKFAIADEL